MIKNYFNFFIIILALSFTSCGKKEEVKIDASKNKLFFDIVYTTRYYRIIDTASWKLVAGSQTLQFSRDASSSESEQSESNSGKFTITYNAYQELGLASSNQCSGGYTGLFVSSETDGTTQDPGTANPIYDPNSTYDAGSNNDGQVPTNIDPVTGEEIPASSYNFEFNLEVKTRSLSSGCNTVRPLDSVKYDILRYTSNGDLIVSDYNRGIEFYMIPIVK